MNADRPQGVSRRDFLKTAGAGSALVAAGSGPVLADDSVTAPLPERVLGRTGVRVPVLGLGTAPAGNRPRREAARFYDQALSAGVTFLDTAPEFTGYGVAQQALGDVLQDRRNEAFVVTKCFEPDGGKALELLKRNLRELQIERADVVYAHSIGDDKMDLKTVLGPDGVMQALEKARRDGLCRFVGISGHNRPAKFLKVMQEFDLDVMMLAVNYVIRHVYNFEERVWAEARRRNIGLVAMKVLGGMHRTEGDAPERKGKGGRIRGGQAEKAFRYALGLPGLSTVVLGCYDLDELHQAVAWARREPLSEDQHKQLLAEGRRQADDWGEVHGPAE